ncbi:MAG: tetratricopeptide repeat protein [Candidatus Rhabdochlamydia sp.]
MNLKAAHPDLDIGYIYFALANLLKYDEEIQFLCGTYCAKRELYLKAIDLNPQLSNAYYKLANLLGDREQIQLLNSKLWDQTDLYREAINLNPLHSAAYLNFAACLHRKEKLGFGKATISFLDGKKMDRKDLALKSIDLNPHLTQAYYPLIFVRFPSRTAQLLDGTCYTHKELMLKTLDLDPKAYYAYWQLAELLTDQEMIQLLNGTYCTKKDLYLKAIPLYPTNFVQYEFLANLLQEDEPIQLFDKTYFTKQDLYYKGLLLAPYHSSQLACPRISTKKYLSNIYLKKIKENPHHAGNYLHFILLNSDGKITLDNGRHASIETLFTIALDLDPGLISNPQFATHFAYMASFFIQANTMAYQTHHPFPQPVQACNTCISLKRRASSYLKKWRSSLNPKALPSNPSLPDLSRFKSYSVSRTRRSPLLPRCDYVKR